jgi:protein-disulfide isomerase
MEETTVSTSQTPSLGKEKGFLREALLVSSSIILGSLIVAGAILTLNPQALSLNKGTNTTGTQTAPDKGKEDTSATVSLDDDPVMGDKTKAKVAIVEFSDYECPFCKRFHAETYDSLVKEYVDTGKAVIVFRDFPLSFHDPKATMEAATAECVRDEKGDSTYFAFGKALYENTQANGKGLPEGKLEELIKKVGANPQTVKACAEKSATTQEIAKDITDGQKAGVDGTPSFIIGTLGKDGTVTGERIVGALPLSGFKTVLDKYLQ